ncbi:ROK family transcriptional regulator [Mycobacterium sp. AZCC_0083]|uniref:ROK family transcriptional regulator n=1 Tax=Mycobacterium sp. AZCC_0083 TaxID=2735882 RepID=UPI00161FE9F2|nr:ROK family transcriptional regulator [Mycobacterium sp. AZCC_0083]MBB5166151.1 putative NBD/HSP70 family sugar kinase [Mycobacterium sp. AZCC_0083]
MTVESSTPAGRNADLFRIATMFRTEATLSRADVVRRSGLSRSTANQRLDALVSAGLVVAADTSATGGRPASLFALNRNRGLLLLADVGATAMRNALCNLSGEVLAEIDHGIDIATGPDPVLGQISRDFSDLLARSGRSASEVLGIGLAVPGPVDFAAGRVVSPPIMTGWDRFDIRGWFAGDFGCPVVVEKDVNAMAVGEHRAIHPDVPNMMMLKVGTGVGSGLIASGQIHRGADGAAGDIGHIHLRLPHGHPEGYAEEPLCRCRNTGCVEAYAGGWAMARDLRAAGKDVETVNDVVQCLRSGDTTAQQLLRRAGRILGLAVADAVSLFNPSIISVCGQLAGTEEPLLAGIREIVYQRSLPLATRNLQIVRSQLDPRAGLVGLAVLLSDEIFSLERIGALTS